MTNVQATYHRAAPTTGLDEAARFGLWHLAAGVAAAAVLVGAGRLAPGAGSLEPIGWSLAAMSLVLALIPRLSGATAGAEAMSAIGLTCLAAALSAVSGGLASPFAIWLLAAPAQAALSRTGGVVATIVASSLAVLGLGAAAANDALPATVLPAGSEAVLMVLASLSALGALLWAMMDAAKAAPAAKQDETILYLADPVSDGAPDLIMVLGSDGRIASASAAARRILGMEPQELEGLQPGVLVHIAEYQSLESALTAALSSDEPVSAQVRLRRKDGDFVWTELLARKDGAGVVASLRDITDRRMREQALMEEAAAAIEQSKSKSRFLANMSHELRTPLNAIIGFSDMIRQEVFGPVGHTRYREYAGHINASGQHLVDMISDLLDMSKIEAGKFKLSLKPVELTPVIDEAIEMLKLQAQEAGVGVTALLSRDVPSPMADRRAVKQIMLNLLSNAIKFTPAQGRVSVSARRDCMNVVIDVRDTGVGIPAADLERIGKPFEQSGDPLRDMQKGTGLGLSLVAALAGLHGGRMEIDSAPGDGTTVSVTLPIDPNPSAADDTVVFPEKFRAGGKG
jgi:two-component system, cell cycle sensor histidine kinase DivJ